MQAAESPEPSDAQANGAQAHAPDSYRSVVVEDDEDDESSTLTALLPPRMPAAQSAGGSEGTDLDAMGADWRPRGRPRTDRARSPSRSRPPCSPAFADPDVYPLSTMRRAVARRLAEAKQNVPALLPDDHIDATSLVALRTKSTQSSGRRPRRTRRRRGSGLTTPKVTLNDLIIKACAVALVRVPACNAQFTPEAILIHRRVDISVSVAVPDGFVTPVVRNADTKTVLSIAEEVRELAARARLKTLAIEEITQGTFSISNLGMFGIDEFSAVVNPPEGAILAVGRAREAAVVQDGELAVGRRMTLTLSCYYRAVDGAVGAAFLAELRGSARASDADPHGLSARPAPRGLLAFGVSWRPAPATPPPRGAPRARRRSRRSVRVPRPRGRHAGEPARRPARAWAGLPPGVVPGALRR